MEPAFDTVMREQLLERRRLLEEAAASPGSVQDVHRLLHEVDAALAKMRQGVFGLCKTCGDPIEAPRLLADPLAEFCLDHLDAGEQRALEQDIELAAQVQNTLLPSRSVVHGGWSAAYRYEPANLVGGDLCKLTPIGPKGLFFAVGDATGKGLAASLLMAQLHALLQALLPADLPLPELMSRTNHAFCESTMPSHFATLVCGMASPEGVITLCNAGHVPPILVRADSTTEPVRTAGLPVGLFCEAVFPPSVFSLAPGERLVLVTDGVTESLDPAGQEFGFPGFEAAARAAGQGRVVPDVADAAVAHRKGRPASDDLTVLCIERLG